MRALGAVGAAFWVRGGVGGRRSLFVRLSRRGVPIVNAGRCRRGFPGAGRGWWAQVAVCTAFPAQGAYCERWALSVRLSRHGNIVGRRGTLLAGVGRCRRGFFGAWSPLVGAGRCLRHEALLADAGRRLRSFFRRAGAPPRLAHTPALPRGARCLPLGLPFGCTSPALPPRRVPLRRLTFPHKDATIISLFAAAWPSAERLTGCGAVW